MSTTKERIMKVSDKIFSTHAYDEVFQKDKLIEQLAELVEEANQILLLTHPKLSDAEMNTLTTRQYIIWKEALKKLKDGNE